MNVMLLLDNEANIGAKSLFYPTQLIFEITLLKLLSGQYIIRPGSYGWLHVHSYTAPLYRQQTQQRTQCLPGRGLDTRKNRPGWRTRLCCRPHISLDAICRVSAESAVPITDPNTRRALTAGQITMPTLQTVLRRATAAH